MEATSTGTRPVSLSVRGVVIPATHFAHLLIRVLGHRTTVHLSTPQPDARAASAAARRLIAIIRSSSPLGLARTFTPQVLAGRSTATIAKAIAAQHVDVKRIRLLGRGHLAWLPDGYVAWSQQFEGTATTPSGLRRLRATLRLIEVDGRWKLLSAG